MSLTTTPRLEPGCEVDVFEHQLEPQQHEGRARLVRCIEVSEDQARNGLSLEAQRDRLQAYCTAHDCELAGIESDDGVSGKVAPEKRPGLARALARVRKGEADGLLVLKLDRLSRTTRDVLDLVDECGRRDWVLVSLTENIDTGSPGGRLVVTVLAALAQMEREQTAERTTMALAVLAKNGKARSRFTPFGWRTQSGSSTVKRGDGELVEHAGEQATLRQMLTLRESEGPTAIAARLNTQGTLTRSGKRWTAQNLHRVLAAYDSRSEAAGA